MNHFITPIDKTIEETHQTIYFAGGCFWGLQALFDLFSGIFYTDVGYANGLTEKPSYKLVCSGKTNFAETVRVVYDPNKLSTAQLVAIFFSSIDPTSHHKQGNDIGSQYRTGIYYTNSLQKNVINDVFNREKRKHYKPLAVEILPIINYYTAENEHQKYLKNNPDGYCHIPEELYAHYLENGAPINVLDSFHASGYQKASENELFNMLDTLTYQVTQKKATEPPFSSQYHKGNDERGIYVDVVTGAPLFSTKDQFDAGCGWPSFSKPLNYQVLLSHPDNTHNMQRTEVTSRIGGSHLGHVFDDGPMQTGGLRYCINGSSLKFIKKEDLISNGYGDLYSLC